LLCVACYDGDQEDTGGKQKCRSNKAERNNAIRALRGVPRKEIAERFGLSIMTISRVMNE